MLPQTTALYSYQPVPVPVTLQSIPTPIYLESQSSNHVPNHSLGSMPTQAVLNNAHLAIAAQSQVQEQAPDINIAITTDSSPLDLNDSRAAAAAQSRATTPSRGLSADRVTKSLNDASERNGESQTREEGNAGREAGHVRRVRFRLAEESDD